MDKLELYKQKKPLAPIVKVETLVQGDVEVRDYGTIVAKCEDAVIFFVGRGLKSNEVYPFTWGTNFYRKPDGEYVDVDFPLITICGNPDILDTKEIDILLGLKSEDSSYDASLFASANQLASARFLLHRGV